MTTTKPTWTRREWYVAVNSASNHPVGTEIPVRTSTGQTMGYDSLRHMQVSLLKRFRHHPREQYEKIEKGVRITQKSTYCGLRQVVEYTIEDTPQPEACVEAEWLRAARRND